MRIIVAFNFKKAQVDVSNSPTMSFFKILSDESGIAYYPQITSLFEKLAYRETLFVMLRNKNLAKEVYCIETCTSENIEYKNKINIEAVEFYIENIDY